MGLIFLYVFIGCLIVLLICVTSLVICAVMGIIKEFFPWQ